MFPDYILVKYSCIFRMYFLSDLFLPIFMVSLTIAELSDRRQNISLTHNQRRSVMKISQCVTLFFNYQRMNVKKKYVTEL
jgi:hypothetical protein